MLLNDYAEIVSIQACGRGPTTWRARPLRCEPKNGAREMVRTVPLTPIPTSLEGAFGQLIESIYGLGDAAGDACRLPALEGRARPTELIDHR